MRLAFSLVLVVLMLACPTVVLAVGVPAGTILELVAGASYSDVYNETHDSDPTIAVLTVTQIAGVLIDKPVMFGNTVAGQPAYALVKVTNTGNGPDCFDLSVQSAQSWSTSIVADTSSDGIHQDGEDEVISDTGLIPADSCYQCFVKVTLPDGTTDGGMLTFTATSRFDPFNGSASIEILVPVPGKSATGMTLTATPASTTLNQSVTITGLLMPAIQRNISIDVVDPEGQSTVLSASSSADGSFETTFTPDKLGTYNAQASFAGDSAYMPCEASTGITVQEDTADDQKTPTSISLSVDPTNPTVNQQITITGVITPAVQSTVMLTFTSPSGSSQQSQVATDESGAFQWSVSPDEDGAWYTTAQYSGSETFADCSRTITVVVSAVAPISDAITFTSDPSVDPAAVESGGSTACSVIAADSRGDQIRYQWTDGGAGGTFTPSADIQSPGYTAPENTGGEDITVGLTCTAICSRDTGITASRTVSLTVRSETAGSLHTVQITSGPTVNPVDVESGGAVECDVIAVDSEQHAIGYHWSDGGAGGVFSPNADVRQPTYLAPDNKTNSDMFVLLTCTARCLEDSGISATESVTLTVHPESPTLPVVLEVTPAPESLVVDLGLPLIIRFNTAMDRLSTEQALIISPALSGPKFAWSIDGKTLTVLHQGLAGDTPYACLVGTGAMSADNINLSEAYAWSFNTTAFTRFDPDRVFAAVNVPFRTPHIIYDNPNGNSSVSLLVYVPEAIAIDDTAIDGSLVCVEKGRDVGSFTSQWDSESRTIVITADLTQTEYEAEIIKSIRLLAPSAYGTEHLYLNGLPALSVNVGSLPGDFDFDGQISIKDAGLFINEWLIWHSNPLPEFSFELDAGYDLAAHSQGVWPEWGVFGDQSIDIQDAVAFIECWLGSHQAVEQSAMTVQRRFAEQNRDDSIVVTIEDSVDGAFQVDVPIPVGARFKPITDSAGNLRNVIRGQHVGDLFFSEYDEGRRIVRVAGCISGSPPYEIAIIRISR